MQRDAQAPVLAVRDLRVSFRTRGRVVEAVRGVSFAAHAGRTLAIVGESGSGKSVSLMAATGLLQSSATVQGSVQHQGEEILGLPASALRRRWGAQIGFVFQDPISNLHPLKTIGAQIAEAITAHRRCRRHALRERVINLLDEVGIHAPAQRIDDYPYQFSGGMRQRAMIAMALALEPSVIIADEPTTALDVTVQAAILGLLRRLQQSRGTSLIFISHDLAVVADIADDVVVMRHGRVVESAPAQRILTAPREAYTKELLAAAKRHPRGCEAATPRRELLTVANLSRTFHRGTLFHRTAHATLADISFCLGEGEILGLVGESGSGKSTIGRIIAGLDRPDGGEVALDGVVYASAGHDPRRMHLAPRLRIQIVFQDPFASLNPRRRVGAILAEPFIIHTALTRAQIDAKTRNLVRLVELPEEVLDRFPTQLSGGQRQRVAIARAIALEPSLVVADEPVSSLDVTTQRKVVGLLRSLRDRLGTSFLFISHDLGVVADLCDRVLVLEAGRIVEQGATESVFAASRHPYTQRLLAAIPGQSILAAEIRQREALDV